jgi:predicted metalloendopeptidase
VTTQNQPPAAAATPAVRPQDDLFRAVNADWLATSTIPDDRATFGTFSELHDRAEADVRAIIEEAAASDAPPGSPERMVGDLYASFMDTAALDELGTAPLGPLLERVGTVVDAQSLLGVTGELQREGVDGLVDVGVWIDRGDPTRYVLHAGQGGLGLPDESYYREEGRAAIREAYVAHVARMLDLTGILPPGETDTGDVALRVMALETRLAAAHWDAVACRDAVKTYNLLAVDAVEISLPGWGAWLEGHGVPAAARGEVVVAQPDTLEAFATALREVPAADWRAWLTWHVVRSFAPYLTDEVSAANFAFYGTTLMGAPQQRDRWKRGVGLVESLLGEAVGRLYVERHYPHAAHERMTRMVEVLVEAYRQRLATLEWMGPDTRERALAKLASFTPKIGMPARWRDYSDLVVDATDLVGNVRRGSAFETDRWLHRIGGPVDRDEWFMTPQTVNAYYNPAMNEIVFPAAILQPPMFDLDADDAFNYGGIGAVIGHEIGHGFDDQGSRYDGDGTLRDWWTPEDRERFEARTGVLVEQYAGLAPSEAPDARVNGALTLGENIGDLGGVEVALHAYRLSLGGREAPVVDGRTGEQRFFEGWARIWRTLTREEEARRRLAIDPHSPPEFRANVVRNVDAFHETYGTRPGDALWLDPEDRVRIW